MNHIIALSPALQNALVKWQDSLVTQRNYSHHTQIAYHRDVVDFFNIIAKKYKIQQDIEDCKNYNNDDFRDFLSVRKNNDISHQSLGRNLSALRSFFSYLEDHHNVQNDRLKLMRAPKKPKLLPHPIRFEDIQKAADYLKNACDTRDWIRSRNYALLVFLYGTGLRISEALSINTEDSLKSTLKIKGKGKKERLVPLLPFVQNALQDYRTLCPYQLGQKDIFFKSIKGNVLSSREARLILEKMRYACDLPEYFTPHSLRHSCASHMLKGGSDLRVIQDLLGHKSLAATEKYLAVDFDKLKDIFQKAHPRG